MAKKPEYSFSKETRKKRIDNCSDCNGNPNPCAFSLQGLVGTYCEKCMEIIDYKKEGAPITINRKQAVVINSFQDPDFRNETVLTKDFIPGVGSIDFNDFRLE